MGKYIIQTRKENNQRGVDVSKAVKEMLHGYENLWNNSGAGFESVEEARNKCVSMIENRIHKAENIRVVEVVCEFTSKIIVETK